MLLNSDVLMYFIELQLHSPLFGLEFGGSA